MDLNAVPNLRKYGEDWAQDLEVLRQNMLLHEGAFIDFARDRGLGVSGVITGDPGDFHRRGWVTSDARDRRGDPLFHLFRMIPLHKALEASKINLSPSASLRRDKVSELVEWTLAHWVPEVDEIGERARVWDRVADLAILLEPIYWPDIKGWLSRPIQIGESEHKVLLDQFRERALRLIGTLDPDLWRKVHEVLRLDAAMLDRNGDLYLLLRLAPWNRRERLRGRISGALWIRHIAEVIRRAFEEVYKEQWLEEDQAFGWWIPGARKRAFGSDRPLDDELQARPYLAWEYGLFTGSALRWYVEGDTEYYAILHALPDAAKVGIELVNLRGRIESEGDNAALKLADWLKEDKVLKRFSMISFDFDVPANIRAIRRQVDQQNIIGFIAAHKPDLEFSNFAIEELVEIAAGIDEANGVSGDAVRQADWTDIHSARAFKKRYKLISARMPQGLTGKEWGEALARYAEDHPTRSDDGSHRPFWRQIGIALRARTASYDLHREHTGFDRDTFEQTDLAQAATSAVEKGTTT